MNCFYHQERIAVGACKWCSRGLCTDCAAPLPDGLACIDRHEPHVHRISELTSSSMRLLPGAAAMRWLLFLFLVANGVFLIAVGFKRTTDALEITATLPLGVLLLALAVFWGVRSLRKKPT